MKYNVTLNGKVYEVEVERGEAILVNVSDYAAPAPVSAPVSTAAPAPDAPAPVPAPSGSLEGEAVTSPMPGVILDVKVSAGEAVKAGQVLLILEAMKMENEIVAPRDGKVAQIVTPKGSAVETGATLLTLS